MLNSWVCHLSLGGRFEQSSATLLVRLSAGLSIVLTVREDPQALTKLSSGWQTVSSLADFGSQMS